jgi:predicted DNA-binding transcriptional regulator AlpA
MRRRRQQIRAMVQRLVLPDSHLPLIGPSRQDANGVAHFPKSFIPTVLSRREKKLISKRQVAQLFGVSMHTIDRWLHDGKLPEPQRTFPWQKWDYEELVARTRLKSRL